MLKPLTPVLTDGFVQPNDALIQELLGEVFPAWMDLTQMFEAEGLVLQWIFYRDGGWLCKSLQGKKNLAWLAVWKGLATVTFYFAERHREDLIELNAPGAAEAQMAGKMLPIRLDISDSQDVTLALQVLRYKQSAK